jgi:hypothetical protein
MIKHLNVGSHKLMKMIVWRQIDIKQNKNSDLGDNYWIYSLRGGQGSPIRIPKESWNIARSNGLNDGDVAF